MKNVISVKTHALHNGILSFFEILHFFQIIEQKSFPQNINAGVARYDAIQYSIVV